MAKAIRPASKEEVSIEKIKMSEAQIARFKDSIVDDLLFQIYSSEYNIQNAIDELEEMKKLAEEPLTEVNDRLKEARDRLKKGKMSQRRQADEEVQKILSEKSRLIIPLNSQYRKISDAASHLQNLKKSYEFALGFDRNKVRELPYAEVDGTKYEMKENVLSKGAHGEMILFMEHGENNSTKKA